MRKEVSLGWLLALGTAGCAVDDVEVDDGLVGVGEDGDVGDPEFRFQCSGTPDPEWGCRTCGYQNSPIASGYPIDILDQYPALGSTEPNQLVAIEDDSQPRQRHPVEVVDGELIAHTTAGDRTGHDLLGWSLVVKNGSQETLLLIDKFEFKEDWVECRPIPTYGILDWVPAAGPDGGSWESVCPGLVADSTTVVFTDGETYDANGEMKVANAPSKVTVACRGHGAAKLKFAGYDANYDTLGQPSTLMQRQSGLRMFSAAYCAGSGQPHTQTGTPIAFTDPLGFHTVKNLPIGAELEAKWDSSEALCLETPRLFPQVPGCVPYPRRCSKSIQGEWASYNP